MGEHVTHSHHPNLRSVDVQESGTLPITLGRLALP